nr:NADH dehydrogenase [ubiquinone] 1 alpha subcomplex assembly factor 2 isoform X1 [Peromyscus maniculatus bairdii]
MGWWRGLLRSVWGSLSKEVREHVGTDHLGNKYYFIAEYKNWRGQTIREKRIIEAANRKELDYEAGDIPTEWEDGGTKYKDSKVILLDPNTASLERVMPPAPMGCHSTVLVSQWTPTFSTLKKQQRGPELELEHREFSPVSTTSVSSPKSLNMSGPWIRDRLIFIPTLLTFSVLHL